MSDIREEFESKFEVPEGVIWRMHDEAETYHPSLDGSREYVRNCIRRSELYRHLWMGYQAAAEAKDKEIDDLRKANEWISVDDSLPKKGKDVLVYCDDTKEQMVAFRLNSKMYQFAITKEGRAISCQPSHWSPLGNPPK